MNVTQTKHYLDCAETVAKHGEAMKAFVTGKAIEYRTPSVSDWLPISSPNWCSEYEYRVKPEPKKLFVLRNARNQVLMHTHDQDYCTRREAHWNLYGSCKPYTIETYVQQLEN